MHGSLQEQLLKAGLAKKKPANASSKKQKPKKNVKKKHASAAPDKKTTIVQKTLADNELPKPIKLEIKTLLKENRLSKDEGEIPYNYTVESKIKRCHVTEDQVKQIASGEISIVNWNDRSYLLATVFIKELLEKHPDLRFFSNAAEYQSAPVNPEENEHPIPDDLMW